MGLGTKIKEVLSSDHKDNTISASKPTPSTSTNYKTPGAFPGDDLPQSHSEGKEYTSTHDSALNEAKWKETGNRTGATPGTALASSTGTSTKRNRLSKGIDEYDAESSLKPEQHTSTRNAAVNENVDQTAVAKDRNSNGAYWGNLSQGGQGSASRGLPERTRLGEAAIGNGNANGTRRHHHHDLTSDQAVGGGTYNGTPALRTHAGSASRDPTEDSDFSDDFVETKGRNHGLPGAGFRESSASSPEHFDSRAAQSTGAAHNPLASGSNYHQNKGLRGDNLPTSQHDRSGLERGNGRAGAGAVAGVGIGAGYGIHENSHNKQSHLGHTSRGSNASDGVPRSSMLDPEPAFNNNATSPATGGQYASNYNHTGAPHSGSSFNNSRTIGYDDPEDVHGPHSSRFANDHRGAATGSVPGALNGTGHTAGQFTGGASKINTNPISSPGFESSASPTQSASSGSGRKRFGPGHEGAKVLHACSHCGQDNDISHYFSDQVTYRLG